MSARDALLGGAIPSESSPYHLEAAGIEPSSSARTRPIGRLALQGGLIPPDRAHSNGFQMSGEPNWCALPPFTTRGSTSPATPSGRGFNPTMNQKWKRTPQNRVRFHFWWRRRELNPRPRIARAGRLRVYLRLWISRLEAPLSWILKTPAR